MTGDDIFIDGEGMAHMFRFHDGHVDYRSDLAILDARHVDEGPVALMKPGIRVRSTFHGM